MITIDDIEASAARALGVVRRTPLLSSPFIDEIAGRPVFLKAEVLQHTGSFKFRGGWSALTALTDSQRTRGVIAYSSGNHAQGVARAAQILGVSAVIVMPADAPALKIENTRAMGAEVVLYDRASGEDRVAIGTRLADARGLTLVKPYDDENVMAGQGTCGLEIAEQAGEVGIEEGTVLTCCGGGGLTSGIATALAAKAPGLKVRPVEPEGFDDTARSLKAGKILSNSGPEVGLCDAVLTPAPGQLTYPVMQRLCGAGIAVSDAQVKAAMRVAASRLKLVVEPGGAVALAAALFHGDALDAEGLGGPVIATLSGGNVDPALFARILAEEG
ncbi:threonine ammonia-lyase [Jannaschia sp. EhC01]|nr:threonine ammonia-lyase [Jannaschia sp. EhC01]